MLHPHPDHDHVPLTTSIKYVGVSSSHLIKTLYSDPIDASFRVRFDYRC